VLAPDAPVVVSYANRCFPTKAVAIWRALDMSDQASLIGMYLNRSGFSAVKARMLSDGSRGDPLIAITARA
jgi:hypothetical protein